MKRTKNRPELYQRRSTLPVGKKTPPVRPAGRIERQVTLLDFEVDDQFYFAFPSPHQKVSQ